jgi:hypothetical protein
MKLLAALVVFFVVGCACSAAEGEPRLMVQDFESYQVGDPGSAVSSEWNAGGKHSLCIGAGKSTWVKAMQATDWSQYNTLRMSFHNPSDKAVYLNFELCDQLGQSSWWNRHQNGLTIQPGDQVIEIDYSGTLWRSEPENHYRGDIKTPIDVAKMVWISFVNIHHDGPIYVDEIRVARVKKVELAGAFAFDFGAKNTVVMKDCTGVLPDTLYDAKRGFGLVDAPGRTLSTSMMYPSALLGDGVVWPAKGFRVDLTAGDYIGTIAFERGGYWAENETAQYDRATLKVNGTVVHEHKFKPSDIHFGFQDTEITDMAEVVDKLIWPAHTVSRIRFTAPHGANVFTLDVANSIRFPLRVAGLILAPATAAGEAFLADHDRLQREAINAIFAKQDKGHRGEGRAAPSKPLEYEVLYPGEMVYPTDWPTAAAGRQPAGLYAITGENLTVHLGVYGREKGTVTVAATPLAKGSAQLPAPLICHGRYLPNRPAHVGTAWIDINHYRPEPTFTVGPDLARSVILEFAIPKDAASGDYATTVTLSGAGSPITIPLKVHVVAAELAEFPIPVGLFMSGSAITKDHVDEATYWRLQESVVSEQMAAGLNILSSGIPYGSYKLVDGKLRTGDAIRYIRMAEKHGPVRAVLNYGGFHGPVSAEEMEPFAKALDELEKSEHLPPHLLNCFDEPTTPSEFAFLMPRLVKATQAGIRTWGCTSMHAPDHAAWNEMIENTRYPTLNGHTPIDLQRLKAQGAHPWIYNNNYSRYGSGIHLWRAMRGGAEGSISYTGNNVMGYAFHNLDGREPSLSCFAIHSTFGVLKTVTWLDRREGFLDCRIRLTLERLAKAGDPALGTWTTVDDATYRRDEAQWTSATLEETRVAMLKRIEELRLGGR